MKPLMHLPKGVQKVVNACPIANSFYNKGVRVEVIDKLCFERQVLIPKAVHDFIVSLGDTAEEFSDLLEKTVFSAQTIELPEYVSDFIEKFDAGDYPELVEK